MKFEKYPDEMLIMHLQAQIDRVLDYDFGSVVSNAEYRGIGKTSSIAHRIFCNLIDTDYEFDFREHIVIVPNKDIQEIYIDTISKKFNNHGLVSETLKLLLKKVILVAKSDMRGSRFPDETKVVYLDGVNKRVFKDVIEPSFVGNQVVFRGFINL